MLCLCCGYMSHLMAFPSTSSRWMTGQGELRWEPVCFREDDAWWSLGGKAGIEKKEDAMKLLIKRQECNFLLTSGNNRNSFSDSTVTYRTMINRWRISCLRYLPLWFLVPNWTLQFNPQNTDIIKIQRIKLNIYNRILQNLLQTFFEIVFYPKIMFKRLFC